MKTYNSVWDNHTKFTLRQLYEYIKNNVKSYEESIGVNPYITVMKNNLNMINKNNNDYDTWNVDVKSSTGNGKQLVLVNQPFCVIEDEYSKQMPYDKEMIDDEIIYNESYSLSKIEEILGIKQS